MQASSQPRIDLIVEAVDHDKVGDGARQQVKGEGKQCGPECHSADVCAYLPGRPVGPAVLTRSLRRANQSVAGATQGLDPGVGAGQLRRASGRCGRRSCWTRPRRLIRPRLEHDRLPQDHRRALADQQLDDGKLSRGQVRSLSGYKGLVGGGVDGQRSASKQGAAVAAGPAKQVPSAGQVVLP